MKPLDEFSVDLLSEDRAKKLLSESQYASFSSMEPFCREQLLKDVLTKPLERHTAVHELYFRGKWADLFCGLYGNKPFTLLEVASGDADMIPQTMARTNPTSDYLTANMNVKLNESLLRRTVDIDVNLKLIDDDAANIKQYVAEKSVDMIAFQHGANDVMQAILCAQNGVDTVYSDWMKTLPKMIDLLRNDVEQGTFEEHVKAPFLSLVSAILDLLKDDGVIAIHHYMFKLDLDWGYPPELFENIVPLVRKWTNELGGCTEIGFEGFEPQWWLFLKRK